MENKQVDILLVEDNFEDAELTMRALKKNNISFLLHVKDGAEALEYIFATGKFKGRNIENKPKVILLDLNMPKLGGIEVLQQIKSDERSKAIPVVVLTSSKESPDVQKCYSHGANSFIVKPVGFENFMDAVKELGLYWMFRNHQ
ncbi:MAG TPA: response regulator [Flavobacterium sp.]|jgi:two-component system response regulator